MQVQSRYPQLVDRSINYIEPSAGGSMQHTLCQEYMLHIISTDLVARPTLLQCTQCLVYHTYSAHYIHSWSTTQGCPVTMCRLNWDCPYAVSCIALHVQDNSQELISSWSALHVTTWFNNSLCSYRTMFIPHCFYCKQLHCCHTLLRVASNTLCCTLFSAHHTG